MLNIFLDQLILVSSEPEEYFSKLMDIFRSRGLSSVAEGHFSKQRATYLPSPTLRDIFQIREICIIQSRRVSDKTKVFKQSYFLAEAFLPKHDRGIFYLPDG